MANPQDGAVGVDIILTVQEDGTAVDLSGATTKDIVVEKPDGTTVTKAAVFVTDGTDGKIKYTTEAGYLTPSGVWKVQGHIVNGGLDLRTAREKFTVEPNVGI